QGLLGGRREGRQLGAAHRAEVAPAADAQLFRLLEVCLFGDVALGVFQVGLHGAHGEPDVLAHAIEAHLVPGMRADRALAQVHLEQIHPRELHVHHLEGIHRVPTELDARPLAAAARLPVHELKAIGVVPVAEVRRGEEPGPLEGEGADVLDEGPPLGRRALDVGEEGQPVEVAHAANHVVAQGLPLPVADEHAVLVLEEPCALGLGAVDPVPGAAPLAPHLAHGVLHERGLGQSVPFAHGEQRALDRLVHEAPRPHLAGAELLQYVELSDERIGRDVPAAPGAVVLVEVAAPALLEAVVAGARPGELVDEIGHASILAGRSRGRTGLTAARPPPRLRSATSPGRRTQPPPPRQGDIDMSDESGGRTRGDATRAGTAAPLAGYAVGVEKALAQAIKTDTEGLVAGDAEVAIGSYNMPVYEARPASGGPAPIVVCVSEIW